MTSIEFADVIEQRVSTRSFLQTPVNEKDIRYILECARKAPSWMNKQSWRYIVIQDYYTIQEIAKKHIINRWIKEAPVLIVVCADPKMSGSNNGIEYYIVDAAITMEHIILAATDKGLGSCWIGAFNEDKIKKILEIPPRIKIIALTPIGYPNTKTSLAQKTKKTMIRSTQRKPLQELVYWDHW